MTTSVIFKKDEDIILHLSGCDARYFNKALKEWNFKDEQSLVRFAVSILDLSEDKKTMAYIKNGRLTEFNPAQILLTSDVEPYDLKIKNEIEPSKVQKAADRIYVALLYFCVFVCTIDVIVRQVRKFFGK